MNNVLFTKTREISESLLLLTGIFLCTDADCNMILGSCQEYLTDPGTTLVCLPV